MKFLALCFLQHTGENKPLQRGYDRKVANPPRDASKLGPLITLHFVENFVDPHWLVHLALFNELLPSLQAEESLRVWVVNVVSTFIYNVKEVLQLLRIFVAQPGQKSKVGTKIFNLILKKLVMEDGPLAGNTL
jgi:hypothetical protein